ncbi:HAD family hydrolase [Winogradskyella ursingii]|uniref:HAD family hydrolase n=1 Tax=Winogradskyella ursingii TaxID=2686079 RepID=UPI0015C9B21E|nr:HAD family hydrolase [Winogradskyella ursingii]
MNIKVDKGTIIVFDLDDTLYNELDYLKSAYKEISKSLEPKKWKLLYLKMLSLYRSKKNTFKYLNDTYNIELSELISIYRYHNPEIKLFYGAMDLMNSIKKHGGQIGLITDGRVETQMTKIKALGILEILDSIVISEEIGTEKPHLSNYKSIEKALSGNIYYYIADNFKKDFVTANQIGWETIGLIDNGKNIHYESYKYLENKLASKHLIMSIDEITII